MNSYLHWDDFRVILAIAVTGTLSGAGRRLGVSHATVFRRLGGIEERLGVRLFERSRTGYSPTLAGEEATATARNIETEIAQVERRVIGRDIRPSGTVRITTTDSLFTGLLSSVFADFRKMYSDINLEISISNHLYDISKREADVAIRPSMAPPETLVGRKVGIIAQAIYGHKEFFPKNSSEFDMHHMPWIGVDHGIAYRALDSWMAEYGVDEHCRYRVDSVFGMFAAVKDGAGLAVLPCYLADSDPQLVRFGKTIPELATDLWLLTHPDIRKSGRIRTFMDFIADAMKKHRNRFTGSV